MALQTQQNYNDAGGRGPLPQVMPTSVQPKRFAAGTGTIVSLQPVAVNSATGNWAPWNPEVVSEEWSIGTTGTVSGGTFTITVNGETTAAIAFNATAATITAALLALGGLDAADFTVTGDMPSVTVNFGGRWAGSNITGSINSSSITGGGSVTLIQTNGANPNGLNIIRGFAWEDDIVLAAGGEVIGTVMLGGRLLFSSIPVVSGLYTAEQLAAGLKTGTVRKDGFIIEGLQGFN